MVRLKNKNNMKCENYIRDKYCRGYNIWPCTREARWRLTYWNGNSQCLCGICKGKIMHAIREEGGENRTKIEKL
jgi:hypothetical protein